MKTKQSIQEEINAIQGEYAGGEHVPGYKKAVKRVNQLREYINTLSLPNAITTLNTNTMS